MKQSVEWFVDSILLTFFLVLAFSILNVTTQINHANQYHQYVISMVEQSHFNPTIMNELAKHDVYKITYQDCSIEHDLQLFPKESRYLVEMSYPITIPLIQYTSTQTLTGYAR